jgi:hypothetical protein
MVRNSEQTMSCLISFDAEFNGKSNFVSIVFQAFLFLKKNFKKQNLKT